jgi:uncharacterized FlgJ-related protein
VVVLLGVGACAAEREERRVEFGSYQEVDRLFEELAYTAETWRAGVREVPRAYMSRVPPRWRDRTSKEITVQHKKRLFFRALAPLVLRSSELILEDRERLQEVAVALRGGREVAAAERAWLEALAGRYGVKVEAGAGFGSEAVDELLLRVDIIPVSLALSQAAEESGWGTSRFAAEGNALFGQWSWGGKGIKPEKQRSGLGDHRIAAFDSPLDSVRAYMQNLNTHRVYARLRQRRAAMRAGSDPIRGWDLADTLDRYSERGQGYVDSLHAIMRVNHLNAADEAYLGDGPTILLIPVGRALGDS